MENARKLAPGELDASGPTGLVRLCHDDGGTMEYVRLRIRDDGSVYAVPMTEAAQFRAQAKASANPKEDR